MVNKPITPLDFRSKPWLRKQSLALTTAPSVFSLDNPSSRLTGGGSVTITGANFRNNPDGTAPIVLFEAVPATSVVVVSSTTITCAVPAGIAVGQVDVSVTCGSQTGTLIGGFLYYAGTIQSVTPNFTIVFSGPGPSALVKGYNFIRGSVFTFGGVPATDVTFIDDTQYGMTVPANLTQENEYVDVVMTEPGGGQSTLRNGFHYTLLARGTDIRRDPGTKITKSMGSAQPNSATFTIDGNSNKPYAGEEIVIEDEEDSNRVLFRGAITNVGQTYDGMTDQLQWPCIATDMTYMLNRRRPIASYSNVSASEVVQDLLIRFSSADFNTNFSFIQQNLALITVSFDGTQTLTQCLDQIASMIGGGRWYLDDDRRVHFFRPPIDVQITLPVSAGTGADFSTAILSVGGSIGSLIPFQQGYYAIRVTFLYSNGAESRLGPSSNSVAFDGTKYIHITSLPIGLNPSASITVVGRRIYYYVGSNAIASGWTVNNNTTTFLDVFPDIPSTPTVVNNAGDPVIVQDTGSTGTTATPVVNHATPLRVSSTNGSGTRFYVGGVNLPDGSVKNGYFIGGLPPLSAINGAQITEAPLVALGHGESFQPIYGLYHFAVSAIYSDGSESSLLEMADQDYATWGPILYNQPFTYSDGGQFSTRGFDVWVYGPPDFPGINGLTPVLWRFYYKVFPIPSGEGASGGGGATFSLSDAYRAFASQSYRLLGNVPYFLTAEADGTPIDPATGSAANVSIPITPSLDFGAQPSINPAVEEQTLTWPNPDGPYLENFDLPHPIDDDDPDLLHEDSGSQKFTSFEDITQLRNRVKVFGSGTTTTADAPVGSAVIPIADPTVFSVNGGQLVSGNGDLLQFFSVSSPDLGAANVLLSSPLSVAIPQGTTLQNYCQVDDVQSQRDRGAVELDKNGAATDGIHEFVVSDSSLSTIQQCYLRAHAELAVYSDPIITIQYATRDPNTRCGATVHVDLSDPPCSGDFLIQTVSVDQIRDEGDQLSPRYTVTATTSRFDLTTFLISLNSAAAAVGGGGSIGVVSAATTQAAATTTAAVQAGAIPIPVGTSAAGKRVCWFQKADGSNNTTMTAVGAAAPTITGGSGVFDAAGFWVRPQGISLARFDMAAPFTRIELLPKLVARIRTPSVLTSLTRIIVSLNEYLNGTDSDSPTLATQAGIYVRYSTAAGDPGWVVQTVDRAARTVTSVGLSIAPSTVYVVTITATSSTSITVDINGTAVTVTSNIINGVSLGAEITVDQTVGGTIDIESVYLESN